MRAAKPKAFDCPKCNERYYDAQRYCVKCGLDFRAAFRACPKCKADTPSESEECIVCGYNLESHDMRRPKLIAAGIAIAIVIGIIIIPLWWSRTPLFKPHARIITGKIYFVGKDSLEFVPMFYEYQSGQKALNNSKSGKWAGLSSDSADPDSLIPLPPPPIPHQNLSVGEKIFVTGKERDGDGNLWYHIRRFRKDVTRKGWVHESNIEFN